MSNYDFQLSDYCHAKALNGKRCTEDIRDLSTSTYEALIEMKEHADFTRSNMKKLALPLFCETHKHLWRMSLDEWCSHKDRHMSEPNTFFNNVHSYILDKTEHGGNESKTSGIKQARSSANIGADEEEAIRSVDLIDTEPSQASEAFVIVQKTPQVSQCIGIIQEPDRSTPELGPGPPHVLTEDDAVHQGTDQKVHGPMNDTTLVPQSARTSRESEVEVQASSYLNEFQLLSNGTGYVLITMFGVVCVVLLKKFRTQ